MICWYSSPGSRVADGKCGLFGVSGKHCASKQIALLAGNVAPCGNFGNFIAYAVMGIPSGILLQRVGYKKTALIAVAIGFVGVGIQFLSGHSSPEMAFAVYLIGAFVAGFSMCLLNTVVNPMLNKLGGEGNKGNQLIQVGGSFNSVCADRFCCGSSIRFRNTYK